jgi:hypothetical protein
MLKSIDGGEPSALRGRLKQGGGGVAQEGS